MSLFKNTYPNFDNLNFDNNPSIINCIDPNTNIKIACWLDELVNELYQKSNKLQNNATVSQSEEVNVTDSDLEEIVEYELNTIVGGNKISYDIKNGCYDSVSGPIYDMTITLTFTTT